MSETFSRSELLKARGYGKDSENSSTPAAVENRNGSVPTNGERECSICHGPVPPDRPRSSRSAGSQNVEKRGGWPSVVDAMRTAVSHPPRSSNWCPAPGPNSSASSRSSVENAGY